MNKLLISLGTISCAVLVGCIENEHTIPSDWRTIEFAAVKSHESESGAILTMPLPPNETVVYTEGESSPRRAPMFHGPNSLGFFLELMQEFQGSSICSVIEETDRVVKKNVSFVKKHIKCDQPYKSDYWAYFVKVRNLHFRVLLSPELSQQRVDQIETAIANLKYIRLIPQVE